MFKKTFPTIFVKTEFFEISFSVMNIIMHAGVSVLPLEPRKPIRHF